MDTRGQPVQVGVIILFGFLVIAFAAFQAVIVPQQNAEVEFQHSQVVTTDMQQLRNDIVEVGSTGGTRTAAVRLGTTYPPRVFAVNPGPASGSLRAVSVGSGEIELSAPGADIESICGYDRDGDGAVPSDSLVYEPNYNVYNVEPTIGYENSVSYRRQDGVEVLDSGQTIIAGKQISIPALVSDYQRSGSTTALVDVTAGKTGIGTTEATGDVTLTLPSTLSADTWETLLEDELDENGGQVTAITESGDSVEITLAAGEYTIRCPVVGVGSNPGNKPANVASPTGEGAGSINPSGPGEVRISDVARDPDNKNMIVVSFTNPGDTVNLSQARFNFYQSDSDDGPGQVDVYEYDLGAVEEGSKTIDGLELRGPAKEPAPRIELEGGGAETAIGLVFEEGGSTYSPSQGDIAALNLDFDDGQESNYFMNIPKQGTTVGGGGTPTPTPTQTPTGGGNAPTVDQLSVAQGGNDNQFDVTYDVSDSDADLTNVTLVLENSAGDTLDSLVVYDGGGTGSVSGTDTLQKKGSESASRVRVIAKDATGNQVERTESTP